LVPDINHNLLALVERSGLAQIVAVTHHPIARCRTHQERVGLIRVAVQFQRRAVEQRAAEEAAIFEVLKTLT
jgi:hypothetical protein